MKKKGMAAVAIAATMVSPATLGAFSMVAPGAFVVSAAEAEAKTVKVDFVVNGLSSDAKGSIKVEFSEKGNAQAEKLVWDSVADKDKEFKLPVGKTYVVKIVGTPEGYKAEAKEADLEIKADATSCKVTIDVTKNTSTTPDPKPDTAAKRKLEVQHVDTETKKAIADGKVEIVEKDKAGAVAKIDFSQANQNVVELEVGKTYLVNFVTTAAGYKPVKDSSEVKIEANADGKVENQILVMESKKDETAAKPEDPSAVEKLLVLQHIDKVTNKEIKSGEVSILEKGKDEAKAQKYDFSKEDNNIKVVNGKTYVIKFTRMANGYAPLAQEQELKVEFSPTDGADTYIAKIYSNPVGTSQNGGTQNNGGTTNNGGSTNNGGTTNGGSSTGLPATGVVASSIGVAAVGAIGSGIGILRKRR